jgi:cytochrome c5
MAEPHPHHSDVIEENIDTHPAKVAVGIAIGAIALVVGIILLAQFAIAAYGTRSLKDDPAMSPEAVKKRLAPVASVQIDPNAPSALSAPAAPPASAAPVPAVAAAIPPPAAKTADAGASGKSTYDSICSTCHGAGIAGAPKYGDKAAWAPRLKAGKDSLYTTALKGKGAMPPKGGNPSLSDADVKAAVDYMAAAVK